MKKSLFLLLLLGIGSIAYTLERRDPTQYWSIDRSKLRAKPQIAETTPSRFSLMQQKIQERVSKGVADARRLAEQQIEALKDQYRAGKMSLGSFLKHRGAIIEAQAQKGMPIQQQVKSTQTLPVRPLQPAERTVLEQPSIALEEKKPTFTAAEEMELPQAVTRPSRPPRLTEEVQAYEQPSIISEVQPRFTPEEEAALTQTFVRPTHPPREELSSGEEAALRQAFGPKSIRQRPYAGYTYAEFEHLGKHYQELEKQRKEAYQQAYDEGGLRKRSYSVPTYSIPVNEVGKRYPIGKRYPGGPRRRPSYFGTYQPGYIGKYQPEYRDYRSSTEME